MSGCGGFLSQEIRQARLAETKLCKFCGNPIHLWKIRRRKEREYDYLAPVKSDYCRRACASRALGKRANRGLKGSRPRPRPQIGQKFGRWTVIEINVDRRETRWLCKCDCGSQSIVYQNVLLNGRSKSCGCLHVDKMKTPRLPSSEIERRLNETKPCTGCGIPVFIWYYRKVKDVSEIRKKIHKKLMRAKGGIFCSFFCASVYYSSQNSWFGTTFNHAKKLVTAFGESKSVTQWSKDERCGTSYNSLRRRIDKGWHPEFAIMLPQLSNFVGNRQIRSVGINSLKSRKQAEALMQGVIASLTAAVVK